MTRKAGIYVLFGSMAGACGVGDDGKVDPIDPNPNRVTCSAAFTITGSWTAADPLRPADTPTGCWPVGTWTFTAALDNTAEVLDVDGDGTGDRCGEVTGTAAPVVAASYSFRVNRVDDGDGWVESYQYLGDMGNFHTVKVSEGGGGECEGTLELVSPDKKEYWVMKPDQTGATVGGLGEYTLFAEAQPY